MVAVTELQPWAMLANGPPWMNAGLFSRVCTRLGDQGVLEQDGHGSGLRFQFAGADRFAVAGVGDNDVADDARSRSCEILGETEDGHDFRGDGDVEAVFTGETIGDAAEGAELMERRARSFMSTTRRKATRRVVDAEAELPQ